jgi:ABC-type sulfate transport system permease component
MSQQPLPKTSIFQRFKSTLSTIWKRSWTLFLSKLQGLASALTAALYAANYTFQSGQFKDLLNTFPHVPGWVPIALATIALMTFLAHGRE